MMMLFALFDVLFSDVWVLCGSGLAHAFACCLNFIPVEAGSTILKGSAAARILQKQRKTAIYFQ